VLPLGGWLVEDELEKAFDLGVALRCHAVGKMVTGIGEGGRGGLFASAWWLCDGDGFGQPNGLRREMGAEGHQFLGWGRVAVS
jgi:hypothetical protein